MDRSEASTPSQLRRDIWTPANLVTALRVPLGLLFPFCHAAPAWELTILAIAGLSDGLDGYLARRLGQAGGFGALLDPICDKFFLLMLAGTFAWQGRLPLWMLALVMLRDIYMLLFSLGLLLTGRWQRLHVSARLAGKTVTVLQLLFFGLAALLHLRLPAGSVPLAAPESAEALLLGLLALLGLLSLIACLDYSREAGRQLRQGL